MKLEFIRRGAATRLILIFAGWSTDARYYNDCVFDGWDTAVVSDYRDLTMPPLPPQYTTIYVFAYSLGVFAAAKCGAQATVFIAINGTPEPVSDVYGIPTSVFMATADGLTEKSLMKFHLRMAGSKTAYGKVMSLLPSSPDIKMLKEELYSIASDEMSSSYEIKWDKVYLSSDDRIFPFQNQQKYWMKHPDAIKVVLDSPHAVTLSEIVRETIPDPIKIGEGFSKAKATYNDNAVIQAEICDKIGRKLSSLLSGKNHIIDSVLEIGVGRGLLTNVWRRIITPKKVVFVDLCDLQKFGIADQEEYVKDDAEEWLKNTSDTFDLILSASTIQWFADPVGYIETIREHLNPDGLALVSTFVKGNLRQLDDVRPSPIIYKKSEDYRLPCVDDIEEWCKTLKFSSSREMLMHLRLTGVTPQISKDIDKRTTGSQAFKMKLSELPDVLTYCPIIMVIR